VTTANNVDTLKNRLDRSLAKQEIIYDCKTVFVKFPRGVRVEFWILTFGLGPCHSWVLALVGRLLAVLEFASKRVDRGLNRPP